MVKMVTGCEIGLGGKSETRRNKGTKVHQKTNSVFKITIGPTMQVSLEGGSFCPCCCCDWAATW